MSGSGSCSPGYTLVSQSKKCHLVGAVTTCCVPNNATGCTPATSTASGDQCNDVGAIITVIVLPLLCVCCCCGGAAFCCYKVCLRSQQPGDPLHSGEAGNNGVQMTELHQPAATNQQPPSAWQPNQPNHPGGAIGVQTTEKTSLPAGWYSAVDPASGNTYYVDPQNQTHWNLPSSELPISQMDIATVRAELEKDDIAPDRAAALHGRLQQVGA